MKTRNSSELSTHPESPAESQVQAPRAVSGPSTRRSEHRTPTHGMAVSATLAATVILTTTMTGAPPVFANDVTVPPSMCVAPFLDQAFPMRWHEHFLMNPTSGSRTWVICPLTYDNDVVDWTTGVSVRVTGGISPNVSLADVPVCYFTVADRTNLNQPPYITGPSKIYQQGLGTVANNPFPQVWQASGPNVPIASIRASIGTDPAVSNAAAMNDWSATVFCRLPPGYSISQVAAFQ